MRKNLELIATRRTFPISHTGTFLRNVLSFIKCLYLQPEVERKYEDVRREKHNVCDAQTREEVVEQVLHGPKKSGDELCDDQQLNR